MELNDIERKVWDRVQSILADEPVASPDHVARMTNWCRKLGPGQGADMQALVLGALLHDVGVVEDRKNHYIVGRHTAEDILKSFGVDDDKIAKAVHVLESHSRYGGPAPETIEAKVGQDADALEYIGAIGIIRAVVRGLTDGSYDGKISTFPEFLRTILAKVEDTFHTEEAGKIGAQRLEYMYRFLERIEKELSEEA